MIVPPINPEPEFRGPVTVKNNSKDKTSCSTVDKYQLSLPSPPVSELEGCMTPGSYLQS